MKKMRKKLTILLAVCLIAGILTGLEGAMDVQAAKKWSGYTAISSAEDLVDIAFDPDGKYYLTKNIDMASYYGMWTPIDDFTGILDGDGHTIKNLTGVGGLFLTMRGGTVRNLYLSKVEIAGTTQWIGAICNEAEGATIENCVVSGSIEGKGDNVTGIGGIVGYAYGKEEENTLVSKCINMSSVTSDRGWLGGIVGYYSKGVSVENCINSGVITNSYADVSGGIIGGTREYNSSISVLNCYNSGKIERGQNCGGICGWLYQSYTNGEGKFMFCLNTGELSNEKGGGILGSFNFYGSDYKEILIFIPVSILVMKYQDLIKKLIGMELEMGGQSQFALIQFPLSAPV